VLQGVIQGVLAGIGFIGAGAILRHGRHDEVVHGVTTAATVWMAAALGIACGLARWPLVTVALIFVFVILIVAKPIERLILDWFGVEEKAKVPTVPPPGQPPAQSP